MLRAVVRQSPFDQFAREMTQVLGAFAPSVLGAVGARPIADRWPALNVWVEDEKLFLEAELPGFRMDDIEILAAEDTLTIKGRREQAVPEGATAHRLERSSTSFERAIDLPFAVDPAGTTATLRDGVLRVTMPKAPSARVRRIEVTSAV
ncbi:MAG: Hsp20/alpha crystallin family protein [Phycisphaerales bacterium]|nr:Hsp20/alpha crystallin family protein [Phycisphaerales bacterium]